MSCSACLISISNYLLILKSLDGILALKIKARLGLSLFDHLFAVGVTKLLVRFHWTFVVVEAQQRSQANLTLDPVLHLQISLGEASGAEQLVHLFQGTALGLWPEEDDGEYSDGGDAPEEDECAVVASFDEGRGRNSDGEIVQPVGATTLHSLSQLLGLCALQDVGYLPD